MQNLCFEIPEQEMYCVPVEDKQSKLKWSSWKDWQFLYVYFLDLWYKCCAPLKHAVGNGPVCWSVVFRLVVFKKSSIKQNYTWHCAWFGTDQYTFHIVLTLFFMYLKPIGLPVWILHQLTSSPPMSVRTQPGWIAVTSMLCILKSSAWQRVSILSAAWWPKAKKK